MAKLTETETEVKSEVKQFIETTILADKPFRKEYDLKNTSKKIGFQTRKVEDIDKVIAMVEKTETQVAYLNLISEYNLSLSLTHIGDEKWGTEISLEDKVKKVQNMQGIKKALLLDYLQKFDNEIEALRLEVKNF